METLLKKHAEKLRFLLVGGANTLLDFGILFTLVALGVDKLFANFISTSIAFIFSFLLNRSFTFKATDGNARRQFGLFLVITMFGLWVIQPMIITAVAIWLGGSGLNSGLVLLIGKLLATVVTLVWNYVMYARFVFTKPIDPKP